MCRSAKRRRQDIKFVDQVLVKATVVPEAGDLVLKAGRFTSRRRKGVGSKAGKALLIFDVESIDTYR